MAFNKRRKRFERRNEMVSHLANWVPRTKLGNMVLAGKISIDEIFERGIPIKEPEIIEKLLPNLKSDLILIGGSPGKGGGIRRTPTLRTARMHRSGRRYKMTAMSVIGNGNGYVGLGVGVANDHREAIAKSIENAKLNVIPVRRGCGSWKCRCDTNHSVPFKASGKRGSVIFTLSPAPKGAGLKVAEEIKKVMKLAGIKDIWTKTDGNSRNRRNMIFAVFETFKVLNKMKIPFELSKIEIMKKEEPKEEVKEVPKENKKVPKEEKIDVKKEIEEVVKEKPKEEKKGEVNEKKK